MKAKTVVFQATITMVVASGQLSEAEKWAEDLREHVQKQGMVLSVLVTHLAQKGEQDANTANRAGDNRRKR